ncbi:MAG: CPBP family intramembrane metalloprotease [Saccharofermentans sp.]|nr:CPBP family intramembrane metalloprotease [Saccharofermentans sp.]
MSDKETAFIGGKLKHVIFLAIYVVFILILPKIVHLQLFQIIMYILLGIAGLIISKDDLKKAGSMWKAHPIKNVLIIVGMLILTVIIDNIFIIPYGLLYAEQASSINESNIAAASQAINPVLMIISLGILGPIVEETVFRHILVSKASKVFPKALMVILASVAFATIHMHAFTLMEFLFVLPHFGTALLWSVLLLKQKNITSVYALHILNNLPTFLMMLL